MKIPFKEHSGNNRATNTEAPVTGAISPIHPISETQISRHLYIPDLNQRCLISRNNSSFIVLQLGRDKNL